MSDKTAKFEVWESIEDGNFYFHLKAANGEIIAQSEGYVSKQMALKGISSIKKNAATAPIIDLDNETYEDK